MEPSRPTDASGTTGRIRPDDELIAAPEMRAIMGNISVSTAYDDPELMALKIKIGVGSGHQCRVRFIRREVHELRALRVERSQVNAPIIRTQIENRLALRREKRRMRTSTAD
jgi:hypothetical protein